MMVQTNSAKDRWTRGFWGFFGATLVTIYPMLNWYETTLFGLPEEASVLPTEMGWAVIMALGWLGGIISTVIETEHHYWNCFIKGAGTPGIIFAFAGLSQLVK